MVGKLTAVFAKKEAEAYCSQGLHQEALRLYQNLLSSSPNLGASFKDAIQGKVDDIQTQLDGGSANETRLLSAPEIRRIRKGWGINATTGDILVCAQAFCQVDHYREALSEVAQLLQKGCDEEEAIKLFAECLVHLRSPEQLKKTIKPMGKKIFKQPERRCRFHIGLTEQMVNIKQAPHAKALYQFLLTDPIISKRAPQRLAAIAKRIDQIESEDCQAHPEQGSKAKPTADGNGTIAASSDTEVSPPAKPGRKKRFGWLSFLKKGHSKGKSSGI